MKVLGMRQEHSTAHAHHTAPSCSQRAAQGVVHGETLLHCSSLNSFASGQDSWNAPVFVLSPGWQLASRFSPFPLSLPSVSFSPGHKQPPNPIVSSSIFSGVLPSWASHRHTSPCSFSPSSSASSQLLYFPYQCGRHTVKQFSAGLQRVPVPKQPPCELAALQDRPRQLFGNCNAGPGAEAFLLVLVAYPAAYIAHCDYSLHLWQDLGSLFWCLPAWARTTLFL